jgi:outer membrane protein assembly factor BamB
MGKGGGIRPGGLLVDHEFTVLAFNRKDGKLLWKQIATVEKPHEGHHARYGSYASNTPVTDGKRLYVSFGSRGVFCYGLNGKLLWKRDAPIKMKMRLQFGEGSAVTLVDGTLLLNFDEHGGNSFIWALDAATGKDRWRTPRDEISSWSAPFVVKHDGGKQVILTGEKRVRSYDLETGKLVWECGGLGANPIPMPVAFDGMVLVMSGYVNPNLLAIKLGREGDLTGTDAVVWTNQRGNSYTPSPVLAGGRLYMLTDSGMLSCLDAKTGKPYYLQQRLPKAYNFKSSPVAANGKLYMASENEDVIVAKMGEQFEVLATNTLPDESFIATPAVIGGDLYLRSEKNLYCIRAAK